MVRLNLIFGSNDEFEKAVDHFENFSDFYPDEKNYRYRQLSFDCNSQEDADMNEREIDKEIMNSFERYHFEIENLNESKKANMKTLIERIVERVIAKKLTETRKPKRRLREATDPDGNEYFHLNDLEDYIYENIEKIKDNMSDYGWKVKDISKMRNYYDFATLLGMDSRLLKTVDLEEYTSYAYDIINNELSYDDDEDDYYSQNESKKANMKTLIERIVKRVIAKKLNEAKDNSITSPTAKAYFMYLKSLDKSRLLSIAKSYHRIDSMDKGTPKMDLVYDILASEHGNKWFEKTIRLPEYAKKFLKESIKPKRRLRESVELEDDLGNLDQYIIS